MTKPDFSRRSTQSELMDGDSTYEEFDQTLSQLEIINICTLAYRPTLRWLSETLSSFNPGRPVTIFDIGCGGGDMLRKIAKWARKRNIAVELTGIDINPFAKQSAEKRTPHTAPIRYETTDIFALSPDRRADFVISSLFTHHLKDPELLRFIGWMENHAERGWFINDLHRHWIAYYGIKYITAIAPFANRMIRSDAAISVARAFVRKDWCRQLADAGIPDTQATITWYFPFRYAVTRRKP